MKGRKSSCWPRIAETCLAFRRCAETRRFLCMLFLNDRRKKKLAGRAHGRWLLLEHTIKRLIFPSGVASSGPTGPCSTQRELEGLGFVLQDRQHSPRLNQELNGRGSVTQATKGRPCHPRRDGSRCLRCSDGLPS